MKQHNLFVNVLAMLASGMSIGWLIGMSISPTVQTFLGAMLALLVSILSLIAGVKTLPDRFTSPKQTEVTTPNTLLMPETQGTIPVETPPRLLLTDYLHGVNLLPIGVFLVFLALGSGLGVFVRANKLLGQSPKQLAADYALDSTQQKDFLRLLFVKQLNDSIAVRTGSPFLYAGSASICTAEGTELRMGLKSLDSSESYQLLIENASESTLIKIRDEHCSKR